MAVEDGLREWRDDVDATTRISSFCHVAFVVATIYNLSSWEKDQVGVVVFGNI